MWTLIIIVNIITSFNVREEVVPEAAVGDQPGILGAVEG